MRARRVFWLLVLAGLIVRVAAVRAGLYSADLENEWTVHTAIDTAGRDAYLLLNPNGCADVAIPAAGKGVCHWSYPPGYWPVIQTAALFGRDTFDTIMRLLPYVADVALAWIVRRHLLAPALILLSPVFIIDSAVYGQLDSIAVLPAVWVVTRRSSCEAGFLFGAAGSLKTAMLMFVAARWPVQPQRERLTTLAVTLGILTAVMAPFVLADRHALNGLLYHGQPGAGGLSLILQPSLVRGAGNGPAPMSGLSTFAFHYGPVLTLAALAAVTLFAIRKRIPPLETAALILLTFAVFGISWWPTYAIWGIPFFLLCGHVRQTLVLQLLMLPALAFTLPGFNDVAPKMLYVVSMSAVWAFVAAWLGFLVVARARFRPDRSGPGRRSSSTHRPRAA